MGTGHWGRGDEGGTRRRGEERRPRREMQNAEGTEKQERRPRRGGLGIGEEKKRCAEMKEEKTEVEEK